MIDEQSAETDVNKRKAMVTKIEQALLMDAARPPISPWRRQYLLGAGREEISSCSTTASTTAGVSKTSGWTSNVKSNRPAGRRHNEDRERILPPRTIDGSDTLRNVGAHLCHAGVWCPAILPTSLWIRRASPNPKEKAKIAAELGLDRSIFDQYLQWIGGLVRGDTGLRLRVRAARSRGDRAAYPDQRQAGGPCALLLGHPRRAPRRDQCRPPEFGIDYLGTHHQPERPVASILLARPADPDGVPCSGSG